MPNGHCSRCSISSGAVFDGVEDPYLRERKGDLADVVGRLRMNLTPGGVGFREVLGACEAPCVLVADELPPSIAAQLDWTQVSGVHHRRGQPHVSHGHSGAVAARAGGRRRCTTPPRKIAPGAHDHRRRARGNGIGRPSVSDDSRVASGRSRSRRTGRSVEGRQSTRRHPQRSAAHRRTESTSASKRTSICSATRRSPGHRAPKGSDCFGRSCCSPDVRQTS